MKTILAVGLYLQFFFIKNHLLNEVKDKDFLLVQTFV
jgi:hypothetical protein